MTDATVAAAIALVLCPRPRREYIEGAPYQRGDRVVVAEGGDDTFPEEYAGRHGVVDYLEYDCGSGQTFPGDPMIGVYFEPEGVCREFWREELALHCEEVGGADGR